MVLIGDNPASHTYVKNKILACKNVGIESFKIEYDKDVDEKTVVDTVKRLNEDPLVDGILIQLPLPKHLPTQDILSLIDPAKDVDGLTAINLGRLARGDEGLFPCTPVGIMRLLDYYKVPVKGKNVVVLGRSHLVGKPVALLLLAEDATVTICHSKTKNLPDVCRSADILVAACGQPEMVKGDWVKEGAVVIDVGTTRVENADGTFSLKGRRRVCTWQLQNAALITPVPGGVGPMTIASLAGQHIQVVPDAHANQELMTIVLPTWVKVGAIFGAVTLTALALAGVSGIAWMRDSTFNAVKPLYINASLKRIGDFPDSLLDDIINHRGDYHPIAGGRMPLVDGDCRLFRRKRSQDAICRNPPTVHRAGPGCHRDNRQAV